MAAILRLARVSLFCGWIMLLASSCIVAGPPENRNPAQTRPTLDVYQATPSASRVLVVHTNDLVKISVPLRSEDAGEALRGVFLVDYNAGSLGLLQNSQDIAASTYADDGRQVTLDWTVPSLPPPGCHLLSLIVAHDSSFGSNPNYVLKQDAANRDAAVINWWLNDLDADGPNKISALGDCPTVGIPTK
ncbi:MAG: hypothetical protein ABI548_11275 [Polyangiaceae bacterium]